MNTHIPGWISYRLSDIYTERKEPGNESLPLLTVSIHSGVSDGELDEDELLKKVKRIEDKSQYKRAATGDLVFNMMRAWQGAIGTVRTEGMVSPAYIVAKPNGKVYPPFMDYYMKAPRMVGMINRQSYGVTDFRKRLYWDSFAPIPCVLPPVAEQKKIAEILATQDKAIELQGRKIEELKRFKKGCLEKMFPRKGQKVPEKRFPGFTDDWEQHKLNELVMYQSSNLTASDASDIGEYDLYDANTIIGKTNIEPIRSEYITVIKDGAGVGRIRVLPPNTMFIGTMGGLQATKSDLSYIYALLSRFELGKEYSGSTIPHIYFKDYGNNEYFVPTIEEQQTIGSYFAKIDRLITLHQRKLDEMKKQKKALMQLLLTGIVRVRL